MSIVIPTYNEEKDIRDCLGSLEKQSDKDFEVIIVDDGSTDNTVEVVKKFKKVKLIQQNHNGPGAARNLGAKNARGIVLIFVDSDMTFGKDYLKNLTSPIRKNKGIIGTTHDFEVVNNTENIWSRCWGKIRVSKEEAKDVKIFRAIRRDNFLKMGGFDPKFGYADDQTFWFKKKIKPTVAPDTTCYHKNPESIKQVYRQSRWIGASIDHPLLNINLIKHTVPLFLAMISPFVIPLLSLKKLHQFKDTSLLSAMLPFMAARYFGTIVGISRNFFFDINWK